MHRTLLPLLAAFLVLGTLAIAPGNTALSADQPAYVAIGDSLAFGVGANNPAAEGYVGLVHLGLTQSSRYEESGLELLNLSVPGATSDDLLLEGDQLDQAIEEIETRREEAEGPGTEVDVITLDIGGNDLLALAEDGSPCLDSASGEECRLALGQMLSALQENVRTILQRLREAAPEARIFMIDLYNPYSGTGDEREVIAAIGVEQVNGVLSVAASEPSLNVNLVPVHELFEGRGSQWVASDGIHPNDAGHQVIATALLSAMQGIPVVLPSDIAGAPTDPPVIDTNGNGNGDGDGTDWLLLVIGISVAFVAGVAVSSTYFLARGRRG